MADLWDLLTNPNDLRAAAREEARLRKQAEGERDEARGSIQAIAVAASAFGEYKLSINLSTAIRNALPTPTTPQPDPSVTTGDKVVCGEME